MSKTFFQSIPCGFGLAILLLLRILPSSDSWILPSAPVSTSSSSWSLLQVSSGLIIPFRGSPLQHRTMSRNKNTGDEQQAFLLWGGNDDDEFLPVNGEQPQGSHHSHRAGAETGDLSSPASLELLHKNVTLLDGGLPDDLLPLSPPLSYDKFLKMQDKRVVVTVRYSGESGLRPYFLTVAKKLKASHPDVVIERRILPSAELDGVGGSEATFEILVDGKVVIGKKNRTRRQRVAVDVKRSRSVFVSMQELDLAISRARRRRRPTTTYGTNPDDTEEPVVAP